MRLAIMLAILGTSLCWAADAKDDAVKKEMEKLQGTWNLLKASSEGKVLPDEQSKKTQLVIDGDKLTIRGGSNVKGTTSVFSIDPSKQPPTIDLTQDKRVLKGIYELDKGTLKLCIGLDGSKRPTAFKAAENSGTALMIFDREKK